MDFAHFILVCSAIVICLQTPPVQMLDTCIFPGFHCGFGKCISNKKQCDGVWDCPEGIDEIFCVPQDTQIRDLENNEVLFIGYKNRLIQVEFDGSPQPRMTNIRTSATNITALAYSTEDKKLFMIDRPTKSIIAMNVLTKEEEIIYTFSDKYYAVFDIDAMVYDYTSNKLFLCDYYYRTLDAFSLDLLYAKTILNFGSGAPKISAVIPEKGVLFFAFHTNADHDRWMVDRINIDGTNRKNVLPKTTKGPINLHYDRFMRRIFWTDGNEDRINSMGIEGGDRMHIMTTVRFPRGLTTSPTNIFWINSGTAELMWKVKSGLGETYKQAIEVSKVGNVDRQFSMVYIGTKRIHRPIKDIMSMPECKDDEFTCNDGSCIPKSWECDYQIDCHDRSDEHSKCVRFKCLDGSGAKFQCSNGRCIEQYQKCDEVDDCGDNSDESICAHCLPNLYQCIDSAKCISKMRICDGISDCPRGEDETHNHNCKCQPNQLGCKNGKCIPESFKCDGTDDCGDGDVRDENNEKCGPNPETKLTTEWTKCNYGGRCHVSGQCIERHQVCDGRKDCPDGEDEGGYCSTACIDAECEHECQSTSTGPICRCHKGFTLMNDTVSCEDIDECKYGGCTQKCTNIPGSYDCDCYPGFEMKDDMKTCKAIGRPAEFFFAVDNEIRMLSIINNSQVVVQRELSDGISGLDIDIAKRSLYYTLTEQGEIHRLTLSEDNKHQKVQINGRTAPGLLAVDWTTNNVYVAEGGQHQYITLCSFDTMQCRLLKDMAKVTVRAIVVDPIHEYIFVASSNWVGWMPMTRIYRMSLDGFDGRNVIMLENTVISGLAVDVNRRMLYFSERFSRITKTDYDGNKTKIMQHILHRPHSLQLFEDNLYFLSKNGAVLRCNVTGGDAYSSYRLMTPSSQFFVISQVSRQPPLGSRRSTVTSRKDDNSNTVREDHGICGGTYTLSLYRLVMLWIFPIVLTPPALWVFWTFITMMWNSFFPSGSEGSADGEPPEEPGLDRSGRGVSRSPDAHNSSEQSISGRMSNRPESGELPNVDRPNPVIFGRWSIDGTVGVHELRSADPHDPAVPSISGRMGRAGSVGVHELRSADLHDPSVPSISGRMGRAGSVGVHEPIYEPRSADLHDPSVPSISGRMGRAGSVGVHELRSADLHDPSVPSISGRMGRAGSVGVHEPIYEPRSADLHDPSVPTISGRMGRAGSVGVHEPRSADLHDPSVPSISGRMGRAGSVGVHEPRSADPHDPSVPPGPSESGTLRRGARRNPKIVITGASPPP